MKINITDTLTIKEIQDIFNQQYPYLKIEFFSKPHSLQNGSRIEHLIEPETMIHDCRSKHRNGSLDIYPNDTVAELEKSFQDEFGLSIQVFRKSGNVWIETTVTDNWTLEKQNKEAESFLNYMKEKNRIKNDQIIL